MSDTTIKKILEMKTIAIVGLSPNETRPSYGVAKYLLGQGYTIIPVNPGHMEILGQRSYPSLAEIPEPIDIVDVFRRPEHVVPIAQEAVAVGAKAFWLQLGIVNDDAIKIVEDAGLWAVQNRCLKIEHARLLL
ncbi:CoA-binding protein [Candidatus Neomarinimicrobiota bacterium]